MLFWTPLATEPGISPATVVPGCPVTPPGTVPDTAGVGGAVVPAGPPLTPLAVVAPAEAEVVWLWLGTT